MTAGEARRSPRASPCQIGSSTRFGEHEPMTKSLAEQALCRLLGVASCGVRLLAQGRTSNAWVAEIRGVHWVVRVPIPNSGRRMSYRSEVAITELLQSRGHRVAKWKVIVLGEVPCAASRLLSGTPIEYGQPWSTEFINALASVLADLHRLPVTGWGPLVDDDHGLEGSCASPGEGVVARWCHASIWPFDGSTLLAHPVAEYLADLVPAIADLKPTILDSLQGPSGLVHSDLHREHLLLDSRGRFAGVLDFGAAFVGSTAWDFASLHWYYGERNARLVAETYPDGAAPFERGALLAVAIGLYKIAKQPGEELPRQRLRQRLEALR